MREAGLGIDIGNGSISIAVVEGENIIYKDYRLHRGELYQNLVDMLGQVETSCGDRILYAAVNPGAVCLCPGIQKEVQINRVSSLLEGQRMLYPDAGSIVEMGAQNSCFLTGIREGEALLRHERGMCRRNGSIFRGSDVPARTSAVRLLGVCQTGEKCAAACGTVQRVRQDRPDPQTAGRCAGGRYSARTFLCRDPQF